MITIRNSRNGSKDRKGNWQVEDGYNDSRVEVRCDTEAEAKAIESKLTTTRERLLAQAKACGNDKFEAAKDAEWRRVSFRKVDGSTGPFWTAVFVPGTPQGSTEMCL